LNEQLQAVMFYDAGSVDINRNPYGAALANTRFISGAGFGLSGQVGKLQFKTSVAWRASGGDPLSDTANRNPRCWFQLSLPL
jgi:hemolysin activation/secretion protein